MAESLGRAVFDVQLDTSAFKAGIEQVRGLASRAGQSIEQALGAKASKGSLVALDTRITSLKEEIRLVEIGSAKYKELQNAIRAATNERNKAEGGSGGGLGKALSGGLGELTAVAGVGLSVAGVAGALQSAVKAAVEFESATRKLQNTLGAQGAAGALSFTKNLADQLGLSFKQLANDFGSFTAAASSAGIPLQQQQAVFASVAKAGQALGLSSDAVSGSLLALQQIASKGTVQMEELRGQLGERLPIAFNAAAKGLGVTQQGLIKLVESGRLSAQEFFPALSKGLDQLTAGAGGVETSAQQFQKLGNAWEGLQVSLGQSVLPTVIEQVKTLTKALEGVGIVIDANKLGLGGGLLGNLFGSIPEAGTEAVVALRSLQEEFNLTGAQARALFTDAVKLEGIGNIAFASSAQFEAVLARLPGLAEEFRAKYKDVTTELQAANAAAVAGAAALKQEEAARISQQLTSLGTEQQSYKAQEARLGLYAQETQLVSQINQVRNQGAIQRSQTISTLLGQELSQAQKLAINDRERAALEAQYGQAKFNQTVAEFNLKAKALASEQAGQRVSLAFEQQKAAAAGKRAEIEAQIGLLKAEQANNEKASPETARAVQLAREQLSLIQQQNIEEASLGALRSNLLREQQAAARDRLAEERLIALNGQAEFASLEQQRQLQQDVNQTLKERAGYANAATVSAANFKQQLVDAAEARGELANAFNAQVKTTVDGSQQFSQMNTYLSQIVANTGKPPVVNVTVNNSTPGGNSNRSVVRGTTG